MKYLTLILFSSCLLFFSCSEDLESEKLPDEFTGREIVYPMATGDIYIYPGTLTVRERLDGAVQLDVTLQGDTSEENFELPLHLHEGTFDMEADIIALLNPVNGKTLESSTILNTLADQTPIDYDSFLKLNAHVKVHLTDSGPDRNIILSFSNVGGNFVPGIEQAFSQIATCSSDVIY